MKHSKGILSFLALALVASLLAPAALAQTAGAPAAGPDRVKTLVAEWSRAKLGIQEYLDAMAEDGIGFKPTPEVRSFADQMIHIAGTNYVFAAAVSGQANPYDPTKGKDPEKMPELKQTKAALRQFVLGSYDFLIQGVQKLEASSLDEEVQFFRLKMARALLLAKALEHHAHHRGQTTVYLRLKGITPPSERLF